MRASAVPLALLLLLAPAAAAQTPTPVPCSSIGGGKYNCNWWVPGDGHSGGALVVNDRTTVGFLHQGTNWVVCQQKGGDVFNSRGYHNFWFAWTTADNGRTGWASAIEAQGGVDYGPFGGGVPNCSGAHPGLPTWSGEWGRPPAPAPNPSPTPTPTPGPGSPPPSAPGYVTATVANAWAVGRHRTRLLRLSVRGAPAGASIGVACRVHSCRLRRSVVSPDAGGKASLAALFRRRALRPRTVVEVRITAPQLIGKVVRYTIRARRLPRGRILCLPPGAPHAQRC